MRLQRSSRAARTAALQAWSAQVLCGRGHGARAWLTHSAVQRYSGTTHPMSSPVKRGLSSTSTSLSDLHHRTRMHVYTACSMQHCNSACIAACTLLVSLRTLWCMHQQLVKHAHASLQAARMQQHPHAAKAFLPACPPTGVHAWMHYTQHQVHDMQCCNRLACRQPEAPEDRQRKRLLQVISRHATLQHGLACRRAEVGIYLKMGALTSTKFT